MCTCVHSISPCVHLCGSLDYEIGIYVELRCHVMGTQMSSNSADMSEVEAVSRGLDDSVTRKSKLCSVDSETVRLLKNNNPRREA